MSNYLRVHTKSNQYTPSNGESIVLPSIKQNQKKSYIDEDFLLKLKTKKNNKELRKNNSLHTLKTDLRENIALNAEFSLRNFMEQQCKKYTQENEELKYKMNQMTIICTNQTNELTTHQTQNLNISQKLKDQNSRLNFLEGENERLVKQYEIARIKLETAKTQLSIVQDQFKKFQTEQRQQIEELQSQFQEKHIFSELIQGQFDKLKDCYKELDDKCKHQEAQNLYHEQKVKKQIVPKLQQEGTIEDFQKQSKTQDRMDLLREQNRQLIERQQDSEKSKKKLQERNTNLEYLLTQYNADFNYSQHLVDDIQKTNKRQNQMSIMNQAATKQKMLKMEKQIQDLNTKLNVQQQVINNQNDKLKKQKKQIDFPNDYAFIRANPENFNI